MREKEEKRDMAKVMVSRERKQERGRRTRLSDEQINEMITRYNAGETQVSLAAVYGISVSTVQRYIRLRTPKHSNI